jgi:ribosomal protein L10
MEYEINSSKIFELYCEEYKNIFILECLNIDSNQFKEFRTLLENKGKLLNGKKSVFIQAMKSKDILNLIQFVKNQVCFLFTNENIEFVSELILKTKQFVFLEKGTIAERDLFLKKQYTDVFPSEFKEFADLEVPFKIRRGRIFIFKKFLLCEKGKKLNEKQVIVLKKLEKKIQIQSFKLVVACCEGILWTPEVEYAPSWMDESEDEDWESSSEEEEEYNGLNLFD